MNIVAITEDDWAALREIRLAALADAPRAFGSTVDRERAFGEERWREWTRRAQVFLGVVDGVPKAIAAGMLEAGEVQLISVWAAPGARGTGLASATISAVIDWACAEGHPRVRTWVVEDNPTAARLYERLGFQTTGTRMPYPNDPTIDKIELIRKLSP
ncbi:ribosomal protein S18 acetylase RimI-like enzyme [Herbihabitans rhizosphaerae]|uniref:Ribosomal protein S18 acetylase RimI-like enzyme n=1 Tax=Herbihabitans rhizosphaerae TaxID=1872711 RepID=A0A4Q7L4V6_9PSEU|nr:GNAT family N-acetyltransferase [Herbihabitans rhizosphaerae]RZS44317.1 ribosomal protein S18 acetylase RimI-like enzyme [Herbihabitans rhizosphaerae]